jgi:hypothetical protein
LRITIHEKTEIMNEYKFQFLDKDGYVIEEKVKYATSKKDAMRMANNYLAECRDGDVVKVKNFKAN